MNLYPTVRSEWLKFRSVRSTMWTIATTVVLCIGLGALSADGMRNNYEHESFTEHLAFSATGASLLGFLFAPLAIGVIGALIMTSEYSSGSIRLTFAAQPRRLSVLLAKAVVLFATALVVGEVSSFASFFVGQSIFAPAHLNDTLSTPGALRAVIFAGLSLALIALFALGIATIVRHTAGSIALYVSLLLVLLLIVSALPSDWNVHVLKFLPEVLIESMRTPHSAALHFQAFSPGVSALILSAYALGSLVIGGLLLVRRDA